MQWHELPKCIERTELAQLIQTRPGVLNLWPPEMQCRSTRSHSITGMDSIRKIVKMQAKIPLSLKCQEALSSSKIILQTIIEKTILWRKQTVKIKQLIQNICASCVIFKEDQFCEAAPALTYILPRSGPYLLLQCNAWSDKLLACCWPVDWFLNVSTSIVAAPTFSLIHLSWSVP